MSNVFDQLKRVGNVEILGAPAMLTESLNADAVKFVNQGYKTAEEINVGLTGTASWDAAPSATVPFVLDVPNPTLDLPFSTQRATIPSWSAPYFVITRGKIAAIDLIEGESICADIFSEVSLNNGVRWPTAQTGQNIRITLANTDNLNAHEPRMSLTGIRLRP